MYVFLYDITPDDEVMTSEIQDKVLIYPTYSDNSNTDDLLPLLKYKATIPTDLSLLDLAKAFGIHENFKSTGNQLLKDVFKSISLIQNVVIETLFTSTVTHQGKHIKRDAGQLKIAENFNAF
jgi:hypothetical protein